MSTSYEQLLKSVLEKSKSQIWEEAVKEWEIQDCDEDETCSTRCVCGKEGLRYLFMIRNRVTYKVLYPIGSSCIKKFGVDDLYTEASLWEQEYKLYHAIGTDSYLSLKDGLFSRKLLLKLWEDGAFKATKYNNFEPRNDYQFLLDMFNKKEPTDRQMKRVTAILLNSIKPFVKKKLGK